MGICDLIVCLAATFSDLLSIHFRGRNSIL